MSKPPRPQYRHTVIGDGASFRDRGDYLPIDFQGFLTIERNRLAQASGPNGTGMNVAGTEGDFAGTLVEIVALLGHALGVYQDLYAREAYISTAGLTVSLVRHARRLAYTPDPGLAAAGFATLLIQDGLQGTIPAGFALASSPAGETKAQTFETLDELDVDAARNRALPVHARRPAQVVFQDEQAQICLPDVGLNLSDGDPALLLADTAFWLPVRILSAVEVGNETVVVVKLEHGVTAPATTEAAKYRFYARPQRELRLFGADADPRQFPSTYVRESDEYAPPAVELPPPPATYGYLASKEDGSTYSVYDVYSSLPISEALVGTPVWVSLDGDAAVVVVASQQAMTVAFIRGHVVGIPVPEIEDGEVVGIDPQPELLESHISATATALQFQDVDGTTIRRDALSLSPVLLADWEYSSPLVSDEPNPSPLVPPLELATDFGDQRPGALVCLCKLDESFHQVVELRRIRKTEPGRTEIEWSPLTESPADGWTLDNLCVFGNVTRLSHGEVTDEILGGSDGITPFLRFELRKPFVTQIPSPDGGEPSIEVRVDDVAWRRVDDFHDSHAEDRHYRVEIDEHHLAMVVFGDGQQGAIPHSGQKHIRVRYRHGLGEEGNVMSGRIARIKKAHPLVERAFNPTATTGGASPAELRDLQTQATQHIRTFDRAVSVQDHADLALLYPGIRRASARRTSEGIEVTVATDSGDAPLELLAAVRIYLEARRDNDLQLSLIAPQAVDVYLSLELEYASEYLSENVRLDVQDALLDEDHEHPGLFSFAGRRLGQAVHRSHVYERVSAVEGVTFVRVTRFALSDEPTFYDLLRAAPRQWLRLSPHHLAVEIRPGGSV